MSSPINAVYTGTFTSNATPSAVTLNLPAGATEIEVINITDLNTPAATVIKAEGFANGAAGTAIIHTGNGATPNVLAPTGIVANGFTFFDDSGLATNGAAVVNAASAISNAAPPVVTSPGGLPNVGDVVRLFNTTAALQLAGMDYTVTASDAGSFTLGYVATAPGSAATANTWRTIPIGTPVSPAVDTASAIAPNPRFYPRTRYITGITAAANAVVSLSVAHQFRVGEKVRITVPANWGMTELNGALATIVAVSYGTVAANSNTITLDISTVGMTAFAYPTSAIAGAGVSFPMVTPVGEAATNTIALPVGNSLDDRTRNTSLKGVIVGTSCLAPSKTYQWIAKKGLTI